MPVVYQTIITPEDLDENPEFLYLFRENAELYGDPKFSFLRGLEGAVGVRLKMAPGSGARSFISEEESFEGMAMIDEDLEPVFEHVKAGGTVIIPRTGFIPSRLCDTVKDYLKEQLKRLADI